MADRHEVAELTVSAAASSLGADRARLDLPGGCLWRAEARRAGHGVDVLGEVHLPARARRGAVRVAGVVWCCAVPGDVYLARRARGDPRIHALSHRDRARPSLSAIGGRGEFDVP